MSKGYVYVLSNPSSSGAIKIGQSTRGGAIRAKELHSTGLADPYELEFELEVENARQVERNVHLSLAEYRVNTNREWFKCRIGQAINEILKYGMPDYDLEILQFPDQLDIREAWRFFRNNHNTKIVNRGYYPVTQSQFAEAAYRTIQSYDAISDRLNLIRNPSHVPTNEQRLKSKQALKGLMEMLAEDDT